jgi:hypothetical protein
MSKNDSSADDNSFASDNDLKSISMSRSDSQCDSSNGTEKSEKNSKGFSSRLTEFAVIL